jgi:hypothetical protein
MTPDRLKYAGAGHSCTRSLVMPGPFYKCDRAYIQVSRTQMILDINVGELPTTFVQSSSASAWV